MLHANRLGFLEDSPDSDLAGAQGDIVATKSFGVFNRAVDVPREAFPLKMDTAGFQPQLIESRPKTRSAAAVEIRNLDVGDLHVPDNCQCARHIFFHLCPDTVKL